MVAGSRLVMTANRIVAPVPHPDPPSAPPADGRVADWAESGLVALTGMPQGPPLVPPGRAATVARELTARTAELTRGRVRLDGARLLAERAALTGRGRQGDVSVGGSCRLLPTADGWAAVSCARADDVLLIGALVEEELSAEDPWPAVAGWLRRHTGAELEDRAALLAVAAAAVQLPTGRAAVPAPLVPRDVTGLLVVDFSALWAGPLCAHVLGLAGARVVKVETPSRPDGARRGDPDFYRLLHAGHRSVLLDPATSAGRAAMAALVRAADIVIEASRPRALAGFGLDTEAAVADGTTWVSITAAGRAAGRVGFGDDVAAAAGLVAWTDAGTPVFVGDAIADPLTGLTAAALAMTAPADGGGVLWDVAMADVVAATLDPDPVVPSPAAVRTGRGWAVVTDGGTVPVAAPARRTVRGDAPAAGADTAAVLAELGMPRP
jgi:crotonobetainyl-CoA:carnitine CoA-transferase CaiB-like acyl-CoA transferase